MTRFVPGARAAAPLAADDRCVVVAGRRLLVRPEGPFVRVADVTSLVGAAPDWAPLGALDGAPVWACGLPAADERPGTWRGWPALAAELGEPLAALAGRALQVVTWRRTHRYCGQCAADLDDVPGEHARRCPGCQ